MRIVICSSGYSGYSVACWRALSNQPDVKLKVYATRAEVPYDPNIVKCLDVRIVEPDDNITDEIVDFRPDIIDIGAWRIKPFLRVAFDKRLSGIKKLISIDTMWKGALRQRLARFRLMPLVHRLDGILVAGERGRQFALAIGFKPEQIYTGTYGYEETVFDRCYDERIKRYPQWPRRFCFVGRYVPIKGLESFLEAYRIYHSHYGTSAWPLDCFGTGKLENQLRATEGVVDHGFVQPEDLGKVLIDEGVFVFPSLHEPWGVALAEAAGAGLPLLCSAQVASGIDLVRHLYNGYVFPAGNVERIVNALCWIHNNSTELREMGERSRFYAGAYASIVWSRRWLDMAVCILNDK